MADVFRQTIISSTLNLNVQTLRIAREHVTPACPAAWSLSKVRLHGGRSEGVDLITIDNGALVMRIVATRGMGILDVRRADVRLGWDSPVDELVHPMFIQPHNRGGIGWLEGFNEYLVRCGLEWFGPPGDETHHHARAEAPAGPLTLHGKIANTPASEVELIVEQRPPYCITLRGVVKERQLFGPKLDLTTEIVLKPGEAAFTVNDSIRNAGAQTEECSLLYHLNHGSPLLEKGAKLVAPVARVTPKDDRATQEGGAEACHTFAGPRKGCAEQVYLMELHADRRDRTMAMLHNAAKSRAVTIAWDKSQLPCFTLWKNTAAELDGYVAGLEPATGYPLPRNVERKAGRIPKLRPGRTYDTSLTFTIHDTPAAVKQAAEQIRKIQRNRKTHVDPDPAT